MMGGELSSPPIFLCKGADFMLTIDSTQPVDREYFESKMSELGYITVDKLKYKKGYSHFNAEASSKELELLFRLQLYCDAHPMFPENNKATIFRVLEDLGISDSKITDYKTKKKSLAIDSCLKPLLISLKSGEYNIGRNQDKAIDFLETYIDFKASKSRTHGAIKKMSEVFQDSEDVNKFDMPLSRIYFDLNERDTGRYYTSNDNIQGYALNYVKSFSAVKGRFLVSVDFAQIDLRVALNIFLKDKKTEKIFSSVTDKYEALVRAMDDLAGRPFSLKEFKANRPMYKEMALATMYGSTSMSIRTGETQVAKLLEEFYAECDKLNSVKFIGASLWNQEFDVHITDYFGYARTLSYADLEYEPGRDMTAKIDKAKSKIVNTPVQTTSASIMPIVTNAIIKKFRSLGYSNSDIRIFMNRHDEIVFDLDEKVMKDIWVFKDYETIYVDDWDELKLEVELYDYYKEVNLEYMEMYEKIWKEKLGENLEFQTPKMPTTRKVENYYPLGRMFCLIRIGEGSDKIIFNNFCKSVSVLVNVDTDIDNYDEDLSVVPGIVEYIKDNYPHFWEAYSKIPALIGTTYVFDINKGHVSKTKSTKDITEITRLLKSEITYVYDMSNKLHTGDGIVNRSKSVIEISSTLENLDKFCAKEGVYYRINRSALDRLFY